MKKSNIALLGLSALVFLSLACGRQTLPSSNAEEVGLSAERLNLVHPIIKEAIARKEFPGAVLLVARKGKIIVREAYGESQWVPQHKPLSADMIFDLASITKPVATATSIMLLVERGKISLWDRVKMYVPEFVPYADYWGDKGDDARIWNLLTHTSGLPPYTDAAEAEKKLGDPCSVDDLVRYIAQLKKTNPPGAEFHYSCLGYITMAYIVKKVSGRTIDVFAEENIFHPLKMNHTFYNPGPKYLPFCVPTQIIDGKPLVGVVHDPLARLQGGVSGNAGLFSTADDLAIFAQMILGKGEYKGVRILSPLAVERMTTIYPKAEFAGRGLGWDLSSAYASNGGDLFGPRSFGHSGYTGTSIWIDPESETTVILLTNSVHPDDKGQIVPLRSRVANVVAASIMKK
ncbi:MAG: serine hydrolase domain-containing protein [Candidatus Aminicenantales bacterium]|jgi:CubicO group peptidase (beta-lactamase class C family)